MNPGPNKGNVMSDHTYPREWFSVSRWIKSPVPKTFIKETEHYLISRSGRRFKKRSNYENWYPTFKEAQAAIDEQDGKNAERSRIKAIRDAAPDLLEALELADAALRGANMNRDVVERKIAAAIAKATGK